MSDMISSAKVSARGWELFATVLLSLVVAPVLMAQVTVSLEMSPWNIIRGSNATLTASASGGTSPYTYQYQYRPGGSSTWLGTSLTGAVNVRAWTTNAQYRVKATDSLSATSVWSSAASIVVVQPSVTVSFSPSSITQSMSSVLSAEVTNAITSVTYEWQYDLGSGWVDWSSFTSNVKTYVWGTTFDARARSVDTNGIRSVWSSSATLTVHPSDISATLSFTPSNLLRGASTVLAAVGTNGTAPYIYNYEWRYNTNQSWTASGTHASGITNVWVSNITFRVQAVDSFSSTSAWTEASLTVVQPSVSVSFSPSTITQSMESVLSAEVTNATGSVTYQWQYDLGSGWVDWSSFTSNVKTYVWGTTFDARARSVDANNVTSEWSSSATLTVHPSDISATLSFTPSNLLRGASTVLAAVGTNGTAPYIYNYEWRYNTNQSWTASGTHASGITNVWVSNITFRVQAVDSFSSTSAWTEASLTVVQPSVSVSFSPSTITQSMESVLSAEVTNAIGSVTYQWQYDLGSGWVDWSSFTSNVKTYVWGTTFDARARSVDANNVTSEWSSSATLTVHPSDISATLSFTPEQPASRGINRPGGGGHQWDCALYL